VLKALLADRFVKCEALLDRPVFVRAALGTLRLESFGVALLFYNALTLNGGLILAILGVTIHNCAHD